MQLGLAMIPFPNVSPEIFSFSFLGINIALRWYALSYIIGFICALQIMKFCIRRNNLWDADKPPFGPDQADSLLTFLIIGVIFGGRLGYVLFYNFGYYLQNPIDILRVWDGGMAFHGGFIGVVLAVLIYFWLNSIPLWSGADLIAIATPPGLFFGRLANFVNAELWGRPTEVPWGVIFPGELAQLCPEIVGPCARHPSQLYEAGLEGLLLFLLLVSIVYFYGLKRPGLITGIFATGYGGSRYLVEFFRVPDQQFFSDTNPYGFAVQYNDFGMTMGQVLSLPMIFFGLVLLTISFAKSA